MPVTTLSKTKSTPLIKRMLKIGLSLMGVILFVSCLALAALHFWFLPRINNYIPKIEALLSERLGSQVKIGHIETQSNGLLPAFRLFNIHFSNPDGSDGLIIESIEAALSSKALLSAQLRFRSLHINAPRVYIQRHSNAHFWVAGIDVTQLSALHASTQGKQHSSKEEEIPPILLWLLRQPKITIYNGYAQWVDQANAAPEFELNNIGAILISQEDKHYIQLQATPPTVWGDRFTINTILIEPQQGSAALFKNWDAHAHSLFPRIDVKELPQHVNLPIQFVQGYGFVEGLASYVESELTHSEVSFNLPEVEIITRADLAPIHLQNFSGKLTGTWQHDTLRVQSDDLTFRYIPRTQSKTEPNLEQIWPKSPIDISWRFDENGSPNGGILKTGEVNLKILSRVALGLPLPEIVQKTLISMNAQGVIEFLDIQWLGKASSPNSYSFNGSVINLKATASDPPAVPKGRLMRIGRPGVEGLNLSFSVNEKGGTAQINITDGSVTIPGLYDEAQVLVDTLAVKLTLEHLNERQFKISAPEFYLHNQDATLKADISWISPDPNNETDHAGTFSLHGTLHDAQATSVQRYLPNSIRQVRAYLKEALISGSVPKANVTIDGPLADFPYHYRETGIFLIEGDAKNVTYAFAPQIVQLKSQTAPWPTLSGINGHMRFTGKGMQISDATGVIQNVPSSSFIAHEARIPDWSQKDIHVLVSAHIKGQASEILNEINHSTIGEDLIKGALSQSDVSGKISSSLFLDIALSKMSRTTVRGSILLDNNSLSLWPFLPRFTQAQGSINFSQRGFTTQQLRAHTLGGLVQGDVALDLAQGLNMEIQGELTAKGLLNDPNWESQLLPNVNWLEGTTSYTFSAHYANEQQFMTWESDLQGLEIKLPEPFSKPASAQYPLIISMRTLGQAKHFLPMLLNVNASPLLGELPHLQASYVLTPTAEGGVTISQGTVGINHTPAMPLTGTTAHIRLNQLSIPTWQDFLSALPASTSSAHSYSKGRSNLVLPIWWPQTSTAQIEQWDIGNNFSANHAQLNVQRNGENWGAHIRSDEVVGHLQWQAATQKSTQHHNGLLSANLSRLWLPMAEKSNKEGVAVKYTTAPPLPEVTQKTDEEKQIFTLLPNTLIKIDSLHLGKMNLGAALLDAEIDRTVVPTRWRINTLELSTQESNLIAHGYWADTPIPTTSLSLEMNSQDIGKLLYHLNYDRVISKAAGTMKGSLTWRAAPYNFDLTSLAGELTLALGKGELLFVDVGAARLLSVLSLQALPSRLSLDFRDITAKGLAFNDINGHFTLEQGEMSINALTLNSINVQVNVTGKINLPQKTQQLEVKATPQFDMVPASIALTVANPAAGLGTLFAQLIFKDSIQKATARTYFIYGGWSAPSVTQNRPRRTPINNRSALKYSHLP